MVALHLVVDATNSGQGISDVNDGYVGCTKYVAIVGSRGAFYDLEGAKRIEDTKGLVCAYSFTSLNLCHPDTTLVSISIVEMRTVEGDLRRIRWHNIAIEHGQVPQHVGNTSDSKD